jgi:hypothetical protein
VQLSTRRGEREEKVKSQVLSPCAGKKRIPQKAKKKIAAFALAACLGCTAVQLKSDEATAAADVHTAATILAGVAAAAEADPTALAEVGTVGNALLQKAGVPAANATEITSALTTKNATAVKTAALKLAAATATK